MNVWILVGVFVGAAIIPNLLKRVFVRKPEQPLPIPEGLVISLRPNQDFRWEVKVNGPGGWYDHFYTNKSATWCRNHCVRQYNEAQEAMK